MLLLRLLLKHEAQACQVQVKSLKFKFCKRASVKLDLAVGKPEMYDGHGMMVLSRWQSQAPRPFRPSLR